MPAIPSISLDKALRFGEGRRLKRLAEQAAYIATLEPDFQKLSDEELRAKTAEFRQRIENGEELDEILFEAYAAVREARLRESGQRIFDVQMMGGIVLHEGDIAEMKTGEGKTFVASLPLYLNALPVTTPPGDRQACTSSPSTTTSPSATPSGTAASSSGSASPSRRSRARHAVRGAQGLLRAPTSPTARTPSSASTTCATTWRSSLDGVVQRGHQYAIVDEVDSILIDEARTPLIISGEPTTAAKTYYDFARVVPGLEGVQSKGTKLEDAALQQRVRLPLRREAQDRLGQPSPGSRRSSARCRSRTSTRPRTCSSSTT